MRTSISAKQCWTTLPNTPPTKVTKGNIKDFKSTPYDGIWACRSLIHIPPKDLHLTVKNIFMLLKHGGYFGSVLFTSDLSHPEEQELPEEHATEKGITYYRVLYPKQIIFDVYRRAGLTPVLVKAVEDTDGDKALSILAQQTLPTKI